MNSLKQPVIFVLKVMVSFLLLALIVNKIEVKNIVIGFSNIKYPFYIAAAHAGIFNIIKILKWHYLLQFTQSGSTIRDSLKSYLAGMAGGILTPGRVGEFARILFLPHLNKSVVTGFVIVDKITDLSIVMLMALPGVAYFSNYLTVMSVFFIVLLIIWVFFFPHYPLLLAKSIINRYSSITRYKSKIIEISEKIKTIGGTYKLTVITLTIISYCVAISEFYWLINNFQHCDFLISFQTQPLIMLTNLLPITIGGLGLREGTSIMLLKKYGISASTAFSAAFLLFFLNSFLPAVIGFCLIPYGKLKLTKSRTKF